MNRETWKAQEREYAKILGGRRIAVTGRSGSDVPDIISKNFVGEVKKSSNGKCVSQKTLKALRGIKEVGKAKGKIALLLQAHKEPNKRNVEHVVSMFLDDFTYLARELINENMEQLKRLEASEDLAI